MKTLLILGANGQLGTELQAAFHDAGRIVAHNRASCDLSNPESIREAIRDARPDVILNAAAYTAVDRAESEPDLTMRINGDAPGILAGEAKKIGAIFIHYSTDYVFDGSKQGPWLEDDPVNPLSVYGRTKLAGERNVQQAGGDFLIFRTSWVFSPHGHNFLRTMLRLGQERERLKVVDDQKGAPTSASAIAAATRCAVHALFRENVSGYSGAYHMTCSGETTWFGFAKSIFAKAGAVRPWASVEGIPTSEHRTAAQRPKNSVMSNRKLRETFAIELPHWETALNDALHALRLRD